MRTIIVTALLLASIAVFATPSTLVYIPSTDVQAKGTVHLGADSYIFKGTTASGEKGFTGTGGVFTDWGVTYGVTKFMEVGADVIGGYPGSPANNPLWLNAKAQIWAPTETLPLAVAAGIYNLAISSDGSNQALVYGAASYVLPYGVRVTGGAYTGAKKGLQVPGAGDPETSGYLLGVDKTMGKWWFGADYQSGRNLMGAANVGVGYTINDKTSVILGYDHYNVGEPHSINFQVDINM
jgi:hypothetical protein